jgi:hypothetical protein
MKQVLQILVMFVPLWGFIKLWRSRRYVPNWQLYTVVYFQMMYLVVLVTALIAEVYYEELKEIIDNYYLSTHGNH